MNYKDFLAALSEFEWSREPEPRCDRDGVWFYAPEEFGLVVGHAGEPGIAIANGDRHALAALAMYQMPFGFTEEHRAGVALVMEVLANHAGKSAYGVRVLSEVHDRISALLPPRSTETSKNFL